MKRFSTLVFVVLVLTTASSAQSIFDWMDIAKTGDSEGCYQVGLCYEKGRDVPIDEKEAIEWYKKAAKKGHVEAMFKLGQCYQWSGLITDESLKWYKKAADKGHAEACATYGYHIFNTSKNKNKKDWKTAYNYLMAAAEGGYNYAYVYLSQLYTCTWGESKAFYNKRTAMEMLEIGWQKSHDPAIKEEMEYLRSLMY